MYRKIIVCSNPENVTCRRACRFLALNVKRTCSKQIEQKNVQRSGPDHDLHEGGVDLVAILSTVVFACKTEFYTFSSIENGGIKHFIWQ